MSPISVCPGQQEWHRFALGQNSEAEAQELAQHLSQCGHCLATLQGLRTDDTLVEALRVQGGTPRPRNAVVENLVQRLKEMCPAGTSVAEPTPSPAERPTLPPPAEARVESGAGALDFLAPPQAEGELGRLGSYRVLQVLGQGGMGVVFRAEDPQLRRPVALKAMLPILAATAGARQRFLREAQAAAAVRHDHVVTIFQVGEDRGVPFLAMELLEGESLEDRVQREGRLPVGEVLRIGREIAEGLAAAHKRGLIHRDIKPANVWLEPETGRVKLLDFGLARAAGDTQLTQQGAIVGTPAYMAPEQAQSQPVDARCDLFSLGAVLYRLATGQVPFKGNDTLGILMSLAMDSPAPACMVNLEVPDGLSQLIELLLSKDPAGRPASARDVVAALRALEQEAGRGAIAGGVGPEGVSKGPRLAMRASRGPNRRRMAVAVGLLLLVAGGILIPQIILRIIDKDGKVKKEIELNPDDHLTFDYHSSRGEHNKPAVPVLHPSPLDALKREDIPAADLALAGDGDPRRAPPGLVAIFGDGRWHTWGEVADLAYSPDGKTLATVSTDRDPRLRLWNTATGSLQRVFWCHHLWGSLAFSPDGGTVAAVDVQTVRRWDVTTGQEQPPLQLKGRGRFVAFSRDGKTLVSKENLGIVKLWDAATSKELRAFPVGGTWTLSADGKTLAGIDDVRSTIRVWDVHTGKELHALPAGKKKIVHLALSPDGRTVAASGHEDLEPIHLWDVASGKPRNYVAKGIAIRGFRFSPGGKSLLAATGRSKYRLLDVDSGKQVWAAQMAEVYDCNCTFSPDGRIVLCVASTGATDVIEVGTGKRLATFRGGRGTKPVFSPDGKTVALRGVGRGHVIFFDVERNALHPSPKNQDAITSVALSPDARTILTAGVRPLELWDVGARKDPKALDDGYEAYSLVRFSPDGRWVAGVAYNYVHLWDHSGVEEPRNVRVENRGPPSLAFSPDSKTLAATHRNESVTLWTVSGGHEQATLSGHQRGVFLLTYSPDGKTLASAGADATVKLWDVAAAREEHTLAGHTGPVHAVAFSPNGATLASAGRDGMLKLWDTTTGTPLRGFGAQFRVKSPVVAVAFSPDGRTLIAVYQDAQVRFWDIATGEVKDTFYTAWPHGFNQVVISPEGRHLLLANQNGTAYVIRMAAPPRQVTKRSRDK
jgi:WD40 repeat protein